MSLTARLGSVSAFVFLLGVPFTSGCGGETTGSRGNVDIHRSQDAGIGTFTPGGPTDAAALNIAVDVDGKPATAIELACGACVDVIARVTGGNPPHDYAWTDGALRGQGPFHLCPTRSTVYGVTVSDSATSGEFGRPATHATASVAIAVGACSVAFDAQAPSDASRPDVDGYVPPPPPPPPPPEDAGSRGCPCSNGATWPDEQFVANASFEGAPVNGLPPGWTACVGLPDLQPGAGPPLAGGRPPAPADGASYVGLAYPVSIGEALKKPLVVGQHYWLSLDGAYTASVIAVTGIPLGEFDVWIGGTPCATDQLVSQSTVFVNQTAPTWTHTCSDFVPEHSASYITLGARVANGFGNGYVSIDALRMAAYEPEPSNYSWNPCATMPLGTPFP